MQKTCSHRTTCNSSPSYFLSFQRRKVFCSTFVLTILQFLKVVLIPLTASVDKLFALAIMSIKIEPRKISHAATNLWV